MRVCVWFFYLFGCEEASEGGETSMDAFLDARGCAWDFVVDVPCSRVVLLGPGVRGVYFQSKVLLT